MFREISLYFFLIVQYVLPNEEASDLNNVNIVVMSLVEKVLTIQPDRFVHFSHNFFLHGTLMNSLQT